MCGIIGYAGRQQAAELLLQGLSTLEYRGYDSAGIAVVGSDGKTSLHKRVGKLSNLQSALNGTMPEGRLGIGHTRWATHGAPSDTNAHPHMDCNGDVVVVHNGIVENYQELKREPGRSRAPVQVPDRLRVHTTPDRGRLGKWTVPGRCRNGCG